MKMTIDSAQKKIRELQVELMLARNERERNDSVSYVKDEPKLDIHFNIGETYSKIAKLTNQILSLKHAINVFNTTTYLPGIEDMTVDVALVALPIYQQELATYKGMRGANKITRRAMLNNTVEYTELTYDVEAAEKLYLGFQDSIVRLQQAINEVNMTGTIDVDL